MRPTVEERDKHMRKIPDKAYKWMQGLIDEKYRYPIFYTRKGRYARMFCTKCGATYERCIRQKDTYEGQFEAVYETPVHGYDTKCPYCHVQAQYRAAGRSKKQYSFHRHAVIGQKSGQDFVWRVFNIECTVHPYSEWGCTKADVEYTEYIRIWCQKGKKAQKDYFAWLYYQACTAWIDHNIGGYANISVPYDAEYYPDTAKELKNTEMYRYVPESSLDRNVWTYNPIFYYMAAARYYKDFEHAVKSGNKGLTEGLVYETLRYRQNGKTPADRLGIYKNRFKDIVSTGTVKHIDTYRLEKKYAKHWTDEEIEQIEALENMYSHKFILQLLTLATPGKLKSYSDDLVERAEGRYDWQKRQVLREYEDYIRMRIEEGYDLTNYVYLFPKDMHRRHNELVAAREKKINDERKKEADSKFKNIKKNYSKLMDRYGAAAGGYVIRPAKTASEIVEEGRILHHCVGGDSYLKKHDTGKSYILFLRTVKDKDMPYVTVEIEGTKIVQWYGAYDKKPNEEMMQAWLDTYVSELNKRQKKPGKNKAVVI